MESVHIPTRSSSKRVVDVPLEERRLSVKHSQNELKRKLSTISLEEDPGTYTRLKIEEYEVELEGEYLNKEWLDLQNTQKTLQDRPFKRGHQEANKRIISLGESLWQEKQKLRDIHERSGQEPQLGPDSHGAFVQTLLALYKDPHAPKGRDKSAQSNMVKQAKIDYKPETGAPSIGKLWCPIAKEYFDGDSFRAAHIVPRAIHSSVVDYIFGNGSASRINTRDNCLYIHDSCERSFDKGNFVLLPVDPTEQPIKRWRIKITNTSALNTDMGRTTLGQLDGTEVEFKTDARPAARFLFYHFVVTLLRNKRDRQDGWESYMLNLSTGKPFATMGPYLRKSMLLTLARAAGDLSDDEHARLLGGGRETFEEDKKLNEAEEREIARRIHEAHDEKLEAEE